MDRGTLAGRFEPARADCHYSTCRITGGGEQAIIGWLADTLPETQGPALVVYENGRVPRMIQREGLSGVVVVATTRAVLGFAEENALIPSAQDIVERDRKTGAGRQSLVAGADRPADERTVLILQRYAAGEISAREAAWTIGSDASEHEVYVWTLDAGLEVPTPSIETVRLEVEAMRRMYAVR